MSLNHKLMGCCFCLSALLVIGMFWIINRIVQSSAFFSFNGLSGDKIAHINHISEFADIFCCFHSFKEFFSFFIKQVKSCPCTFQS